MRKMNDRRPIHPGNLQCFIDCYRSHLIKAHQNDPSSYAWPITELDTVMSRMTSGIERNSFNKDSKAFKDTCKELGIKHTYQAIRDFITL